jgi:hypothetical protein
VYGNADDIGRVMFPVVTFNAQGVASTTKREFPTPNVIPESTTRTITTARAATSVFAGAPATPATPFRAAR